MPIQHRIDGETAVLLLRGDGRTHQVKIDASRLDFVLSFGSWTILNAYKHRGKERLYAVHSARIDGKKVSRYLHRVLTDAPRGMEVDHINRDGLDNRSCNLRVVTVSENHKNTDRWEKYRAAKGGAQ